MCFARWRGRRCGSRWLRWWRSRAGMRWRPRPGTGCTRRGLVWGNSRGSSGGRMGGWKFGRWWGVRRGGRSWRRCWRVWPRWDASITVAEGEGGAARPAANPAWPAGSAGGAEEDGRVSAAARAVRRWRREDAGVRRYGGGGFGPGAGSGLGAGAVDGSGREARRLEGACQGAGGGDGSGRMRGEFRTAASGLRGSLEMLTPGGPGGAGARDGGECEGSC